MEKSKMLTTMLAGLIAINTLGGCASEKTLADNSKSDVIKEEINDEQEVQEDIIELSTEEVYSEDLAINDIKLLEHKAKVTSIDLSNNPIYKRAVIIVNESSQSDKSVKEVYDWLKSTNSLNEDFNDIEGNYSLDDYIFVNDMAYKVEIEEKYQAIKEELIDGKGKKLTIYCASYGGILSGTIVSKTTLLNEEDTISFLEEYGYINKDVVGLKNTL